MYRADFAKWLKGVGFGMLFVCQSALANDYCGEEEDCICEHTPPQHVHFSSRDFDIYEEKQDAVYQDADWPSRVEEFSDYLSK